MPRKLELMTLHIHITNPAAVTTDEQFDELVKIIERMLVDASIDSRIALAVHNAKLSYDPKLQLTW